MFDRPRSSWEQAGTAAVVRLPILMTASCTIGMKLRNLGRK